MWKIDGKKCPLMACRILLTIIGWIVLITYSHRLSHKYVGGINAVFESHLSQMGAQIVVLTAITYLVILSFPALPKPKLGRLCLIVFWVSLLVLGHQLSHQSLHELQGVLTSTNNDLGFITLVLSGIAYLLILALPFVPGVELGLLIMVFFGREGIIAAYLATVGGLCLAYAAASLLPSKVTSRWLSQTGLADAAGDPGAAISSKISGGLFRRIGNFLAKHRYLTLAACLNLPGNSALGGGGGIAFLCGLSNQFNWRNFTLTITLATAPIPLLVIMGMVSLEPLLERHGMVHDVLIFFEGIFIHE